MTLSVNNKDYTLRLIQKDDIVPYFKQNYVPLDPILVHHTGCKADFSFEEVDRFIRSSIEDPLRHHFILVDSGGLIVGESVLSDVDHDVASAHYRLALFNDSVRGLGLGRFMIQEMLKYGFSTLKLHRIELEVFSYNERAIGLYHSCGFTQEGVLRDAIKNDGTHYDLIVMSILEPEWRNF